MIDGLGIRRRWEADGSKRDERGRRVFAASETRAAGRGGLAAVSAITGLARSTIGRGVRDLDAEPPPRGRVRREGGGPKPLSERDPTLLADLMRLVEPATRGDPERLLLWVSKSLDKLASALADMGHAISPNSVRKLLTQLGFSRQANRKAAEGASHPDRNAQFEHIGANRVRVPGLHQNLLLELLDAGLIRGHERGPDPSALGAQHYGGRNAPPVSDAARAQDRNTAAHGVDDLRDQRRCSIGELWPPPSCPCATTTSTPAAAT
jgi:hypothetical protein